MSTKVAAAKFQKEFGRYRSLAQREAVTVTSYGRDDVVLISVEEYQRLMDHAQTPSDDNNIIDVLSTARRTA